jgi:hypothetical protein
MPYVYIIVIYIMKIYYSHEASIYSTIWTPFGELYSLDRWKRSTVDSIEELFLLQVDCGVNSGYFATHDRETMEEHIKTMESGGEIPRSVYTYDLMSEESCHDIGVIIEKLFDNDQT